MVVVVIVDWLDDSGVPRVRGGKTRGGRCWAAELLVFAVASMFALKELRME